MTPTKTCSRNSTFGAVKRMSTDSDDLDWSASQRNAPEDDDGVNALSSLLLSLILKLEDREHRVTIGQLIQSADESSDCSRQKRFADYGNVGALVTREDWDCSTDSNTEDTVDDDDDHDTITELRGERSQIPTRSNYNQITLRDSDTGSSSSELSRDDRSDVPGDTLQSSTNTFDDVTLTSLCKQCQGSAYRESASAEHIAGDALLRAIAKIFTNGVLRRGVRTYGSTVWNLTDYRNTEVTISDGYVGQPLIPLSEGVKQNKRDFVSSKRLSDVNRRIAAPHVTIISHPDSKPPSVASSCDVSRCSSVDILSCGDRALKVKAIPPAQSRLLWRMVQKSHGSNNLKNPADEPSLPVYVPVNDCSNKERKVGLSEALERVKESTPRMRFWGEKSTDGENVEDDTCLKLDRPVKFRDSAVQTEVKPFQKDDKSRDDDAIDVEPIREANSPPYIVQTDEQGTNEVPTAQTDQEPTLQMKQLNVPPTASPLLMDVVWRHASENDMTNHEQRKFKAHFARGGVRETERAKGVVESVVHRAVSAVFVERVVSDSLESLASLSELRITPSFKMAAANLTKGPPLQFEWFPYLEGSAGPCKVTARRRQRVHRKDEGKLHPQIKGSSESSEVYEDAREKFGSTDDLLTDDFKSLANSSDDEFTDAVCEADCTECQANVKKTTTIDKATQVSHTAYGKDSSGSPSDDIEDEPERPAVQLELPMESINYIKDQFNDVKDLVAKYRELLYEPLDESAVVESKTRPQTKPDEPRTSPDLRGVNTAQNKPRLDETDDDVVARKPKQKHTKVEKDMKKDQIQPDGERTDDKSKEKTDKDKKESTVPANREMTPATQDIPSKDEDTAESTNEQHVSERPPKVKDKRKKRDNSSTRDKTGVRRTLRKTGNKMRTSIGRQKFGKTVLEKTTQDGFLPKNVQVEPENLLKSEKKNSELLTGGTSLEAEEKAGTSSKPTEEDKPKVKTHISFFEKFSKHSLKRSNQTRLPSNSPSPEPETPAERAIHKLERLSASQSTKQNVTHQSDEMKRKGKDIKKVNPESGVDSTPGKGIWTNRAFFEALGDLDDQTIQTSIYKPPKTAKGILEDGLLDDPRKEEDGKSGPSLTTKREISRREQSLKRSPEKTDEKSTSTSSRRKKKSRNKNANNEALMKDQVTTDDSCISSSQCSYTDTAVDVNDKITADRSLSSKSQKCDNVNKPEAKTSDEVESTVQNAEVIPKLSSESLNTGDSDTTESGRVSSSPRSHSKIKNGEDAVILNNITYRQPSSETVNGDEATTTETRCVSSNPKGEDAFLSHQISPRQQHSSESLNNCKAKLSDASCIPKSPSDHIEMENEDDAKDTIFDQKLSSGSLQDIDGPCTFRSHNHSQMDHNQDNAHAVNKREPISKNCKSTESMNESEPHITEIKKSDALTTNLDDDNFGSSTVGLQSHNHHIHNGQSIAGDLTTEELKVNSAEDLLFDLSLTDDLSQEVLIHSSPPTEELDDVNSLNNQDVPLLTSSPQPHRHLKKSNTSSERSIKKGGIPDNTPPILRYNRDDVNDGDEEIGEDFLHHLRNTSFLMACNPDCYASKDQPIQDAEINKDVDERQTRAEQETITSTRLMENPQSQTGVNIFKVSAQPKGELPGNVCREMKPDGEQEAAHTSEREKCSKQKSCLRFSLFRKSNKRSRSKSTSLEQSEEQQQQSSDSDCIPHDETHTASKEDAGEDAVAMVTKGCTKQEADMSTGSNQTPSGSHQRKFRLKYLRKLKKQKASSKT